MSYELAWAGQVAHDLDLVEVIDPVVAEEIRTAAGLLALSPLARGVRVNKPFYDGMEYRFLVRDHIRVRLNFTFVPGQNQIAIEQMVLNRLRPTLPLTG